MTTNERRPIHHASTLVRQSSEPGAASTAPALAHTYGRGASVSDRTCSIDGCAKPHYARSYCSMHYRRVRDKGDPHAGPTGTPAGAPLAFVAVAVASATDDCIVWPFALSDNGYGKVNIGGGMRNVHRIVLEQVAGQPPVPGMYAAHAPLICHNRACVNPRHLRWATPTQNSADKLIDGDTNRGERHGNSKLTATQVLAIFRDRRSCEAIAADYGVSKSNVLAIRTGRTWGWLTHTSKAVA